MLYPLYRPPEGTLLSQGEILDPAPLRDNLRGHQEYFSRPQFYRYIIVTQTCDLARTEKRPCSEFITLCVVRKLDEALGWRHVEGKAGRESTERLLTDLLNHNYNKRGFFYLPQEPSAGIDVDSVADLRVMFSLHRVQYDDLRQVRIGAITDVYAAQPGHMIAYMYSRIATPGWDELSPEQPLKAKARAMREEIERREEQRLTTLTERFGKECAMTDCNRNAETFRWRLVRREEHQGTSRYEAHLLCREHATQHDQGTLTGTIRHQPLDDLVS